MGTRVRSTTYPAGRRDMRVADYPKENGVEVGLSSPRVVCAGNNLFALKRVQVDKTTNILF
ncbi:MAG: hypothetical protein KBD24_02885 [Candidatus Pacebacteria bacterium]|nr:hypothetical protein [Candidatus Paceibacterota bacterium]